MLGELVDSPQHQLRDAYLFWPSAYPLDSSGFLVGWRLGEVICVATLVADVSESTLSRINQIDQRHVNRSHACVLGKIRTVDSSIASREQCEDWIIIMNKEGTLHLAGSSENKRLIVVIYDRPCMRKHHFLSLRPLLKPSLFSNESSASDSNSKRDNKNNRLTQKIKLFEEFYPELSLPNGMGKKTQEMTQLINFVNSSEELHHQIHNRPTSSHSQPSQTRTGSCHPNVLRDPPSLIESILALSTFLQQVNVRLVEISSWPSRYRKIRQERSSDLAGRRAEYVMLFNTLWLISNDIIFGRASGTILMGNSQLLSDWLEYHLTTYTVKVVKEALNWTNSYPAGLKLNDQLGLAFCNCSVAAVDFWHNYVLKYAFSSLPQLIWVVGVCSFLGNTFTLAIASDFLTITTLHLWIIYRVFTFIFSCQLKFLSVLFNIFRGRKYNELRNRNEPATYQLDQLILGTILFTLAIFLFPTILAFYMLMSSIRVVIIWTHGIIVTGLSLLNHFPLFVFLLRLKDPARLPAGVSFVPSNDHKGTHLKLQNVPVGLTWIFADYISLWANLTSHYSPQQLIIDLCSGKPIAPLSGCRVYTRP